MKNIRCLNISILEVIKYHYYKYFRPISYLSMYVHGAIEFIVLICLVTMLSNLLINAYIILNNARNLQLILRLCKN